MRRRRTPSEPDRAETLVATRSPMVAVIYESGGWLRVLGSGHPRLPRSLPGWNLGRSWQDPDSSPPFLLVADDVVGGGPLGEEVGKVYYFAPDSLKWEATDTGYTDFLNWFL